MKGGRSFHTAALFGWLFIAGGSAAAETSDIVNRSELKVCADPNNPPFSDEKKEGFENKIAEMMGAELNLKVDYAWFPQVIGFVRNTLRAHLCDLVMGTVTGDEIMQTTNPYYFTTYVMFYRADKGRAFESPQDPQLASLRLGVVAGTPPSDLLVRHELMAHTRPYALTVDTRSNRRPAKWCGMSSMGRSTSGSCGDRSPAITASMMICRSPWFLSRTSRVPLAWDTTSRWGSARTSLNGGGASTPPSSSDSQR
jgi:hypothetical protein